MSGFAGIVSLDGAPADAPLLQRMAERLAFRGPDGTHITTKPGAGFCFTFLRTGPAPQCPSQPCSLDGRVWLLGDVRLDGRDDLQRKLEQHGDDFAGDVTDEELVLRAWRRWGEEGLPDLLGDYAFALWDAEARKLWCARDLMGARPFFYAQAGSHLYFSNTLDAIRCAPDISTALDPYFIGDFLLEGWCPDASRTAFRDISRLPSGHALSYSINGKLVRRFMSLPVEEPLRLKRREQYVEQFRELLEQAVSDRLPCGPTAILMSGGLDSTSVAALAIASALKRGVPLALRAYSLEYQPLFDDQEGYLASRAAQHFGIPIEIHSGAACFPYEGWDNNLKAFLPEPWHEPLGLLYVRQIRSVAEHARVAFSGYGGDGTLTGQAWPYLVDLVRRLRFGTIVQTFGGYILEHRRIPPLRGGFRSAFRRWLKRAGQAEYPQWLAEQFERELRLPERWCELQQAPARGHPWYPDSFATLNSTFWPSVLEGEDPAWTGVAVESRAPLLDLRIQRFLLRVPPVPLCVDKELLRRAVGDLLPEEIRRRPKMPLAGEPLELQQQMGRWSPLPVPSPPESICAFVDWKKLRTTLENSEGFSPWADLRPISLLYWLAKN